PDCAPEPLAGRCRHWIGEIDASTCQRICGRRRPTCEISRAFQNVLDTGLALKLKQQLSAGLGRGWKHDQIRRSRSQGKQGYRKGRKTIGKGRGGGGECVCRDVLSCRRSIGARSFILD